MNKPWIRDDYTWMDGQVISGLRIIALYRSEMPADELIIAILGMPFLDSVEEHDVDIMQALKVLASLSPDLLHQALSGLMSGPGITDDQAESVPLLLVEQHDTHAAEAIRNLPWAGDGITAGEITTAVDMHVLAAEAPETFWVLVGKAWMQEIAMLTNDFEDLVRSFRYIATGTGRDRVSALHLARMPFLESFGARDSGVMETLGQIHREGPESLAEFLSDPRLRGGITDGTAGVVSDIAFERRRASNS